MPKATNTKKRVLVAEDNSLNRGILRSMLADEYDIIEAENGKQALRILEKEYASVSAVLLDIVMPVMSGFEVLEKMRNDAKLSIIPVVVATGVDDEDAEVQALSLGADDYITKPYNPSLILHCLRNTINLRETAATLRKLQRDFLTGLYTRELFFEKAKEKIESKENGHYILVSFNIDNFKVINDQYGTEKGDKVLKHIAACVDRYLSKVDGLCCRVSADSFAALYPAESKNSKALKQCRESINTPECIDRPITIRIGRYLVDDKTVSVSTMYDRASIAEESVKGLYGVSIAEYVDTMLADILREQEIVSDMKGALESGQFEVWYQPQFNHSSGALIGAEALVRWNHPQKGIINPDEFIRVFERNGFIYELDKYVWNEVCRYIRERIAEDDIPLPISVNVSRCDLFCEDVTDRISEAVDKNKIPIELLRLEITESAFATSSDRVIDVVEQLTKKGFIVEIDDFGSGYSSLNTLKDVPADIIKLDMRFLENGRNPERGGNILESVVRMARWLGMPVIAEGVETIEQAEFLKSIGCYYVQGFLYAHPMPASEYTQFSTKRSKEDEMLKLQTLEHLDNVNFWDPHSLETLIFNSYVGGACIFEYNNGRAELLRINENYAREVGAGKLTASEAQELVLEQYMDVENAQRMDENIKKAIETNKESSCEVCLTGVAGYGVKTYLRVAVRVIAQTDTRYLLYSTVFNTTALREAERKEREAFEQMRAVMDDTPGGFCQMQIQPDRTARITYVNAGFCKLVGMDKDSLRSVYGTSALKGVHPNDRTTVREAFRSARSEGGQLHIKCRLRHSNGSYIDTVLFGRIIETENNEVYVNAYYTDITQQLRLEEERKELLDNLPCGAGLFRYVNGKIKVEHLNKRYWQLVERPRKELASTDVKSALHADDYDNLIALIGDAVKQNREIGCAARIKYADSETRYINFQINGRAIENGDNSYSIYLAFLPLSKESTDMVNTVPLVLSAIMDSTTDLSFAKDKELRYLCGSRPFIYMIGLESESDLIGKTDYDLFEKSIADRYRADDKKVLKTGKSLVDILEPIPSDESNQHYSSTSKHPLRDESGNVIGIYGVGRDITEYRTAFEQLKLLTETVPGGIASFEITKDGLENIYFNEGFYNYTGYTRDEFSRIINFNPLGLICEEDLPPILDSIERARCGEIVAGDFICRYWKKDGGYRWVNLRAIVSEALSDTLIINVVKLDITELKQMEEQLRMSEEQYKLVMQQCETIMCRYDVEDRSVNMTKEVAAIFGTQEKVVDVPYSTVSMGNVASDSVDAFIDFYEGVLRGEKSGTAEFECKTVQGWRWLKANQSTIFSDDGAPAYAVISFVDITEQHTREMEHNVLLKNESALKRKADIDGLTEVFNKTTAEENIRERLKVNKGAPCTFMLLDIDNLKVINDSLGHPQGDRAIKIVADVIESSFRHSDVVGRFGGDEFVVFLSGVSDRENVEKMMEMLKSKVNEARIGEDDDHPLSISIGAAFGVKNITFEELYDMADKALYEAKRSGRNSYSIYSDGKEKGKKA